MILSMRGNPEVERISGPGGFGALTMSPKDSVFTYAHALLSSVLAASSECSKIRIAALGCPTQYLDGQVTLLTALS